MISGDASSLAISPEVPLLFINWTVAENCLLNCSVAFFAK